MSEDGDRPVRNRLRYDSDVYRNKISAANEALRSARTGSDVEVFSTDEIVNNSPVVTSLKAELDAARDHIITLNERISKERTSLLSESENAERIRSERERKIAQNFARRESELEERVKAAVQKAEMLERDVFKRREKQDDLYSSKLAEFESMKANLEARIADFEIEQAKYQSETQDKLQSNSKGFVSEMVGDLGSKAKDLSRISLVWAIAGGLILLASGVVLAWITYLSFKQVSIDISWPLLAFYTAKGTVLAAIAGVASRYAFVMSTKYMTEGLRTEERVHAIKFGQFYVETYGAAASWEQVRETFSNWNGDQEKNEKSQNASDDTTIKSILTRKKLLIRE